MTARMPDIAPTLTDTQVLEFCHRGYLILEGVVALETNERVGEFIRAHPYAAGDGGEFEDDRLLAEEWFVKEVILNRQAAGAVRSQVVRVRQTPEMRRRILVDTRQPPTDENTWFPPFRWSAAYCRQCQAHLGWLFTLPEDGAAAAPEALAMNEVA